MALRAAIGKQVRDDPRRHEGSGEECITRDTAGRFRTGGRPQIRAACGDPPSPRGICVAAYGH